MLRALEQIRWMRGGAQAHLMRCSEENYHVVKFQNNPQHRRDYGYRRNGTRGFVQTLSVTRAPGDVKLIAYTAERIRRKIKFSEFTTVTDVHLIAENRTAPLCAGYLARRRR